MKILTASKRRGFTGVGDYYDYNLLAVIILLTCFGLVMLYSTSAYEASVYRDNDMYYFGKQAVISAASIVMLVIASRVDYHLYVPYSWALYGLSILLLIITWRIGDTVNGASRWLRIGPMSFQPAELAKVAVILFLSWMIVSRTGQMKDFKEPAMVFGAGAIVSLATYIFTQNLSTALIIVGISFVLIFIPHQKVRPFLLIFGGAISAAILFAVLVVPKVASGSGRFRLRRILVWLDPEAFADEGGYQVMQGLYAIGSGGLFGKGLGNSTQKLGALPEAKNDMVFSIICEELGIFGAVIVIALFIFLLYRLEYIARHAPDLLGSLIVTGIFIHISLQVLLNIAVVINMIPTTGISLPFISYGGSSIMFLMMEMAVAMNVSGQIRR